jgi:steroid delta-isomerase-like uncharacterized protein
MSLRALAIRWYQEVWNERNPVALRELLAPHAVAHTEGGDIHGAEQFIELFHTPFLEAFPDIQVTVEDVLSIESDAVVRWRATGCHRGPAFGIPPTGRQVTLRGMSWLRFENGLIVEGWDHWNFNGLLAALTDGSCSATVGVQNVAEKP